MIVSAGLVRRISWDDSSKSVGLGHYFRVVTFEFGELCTILHML